LWVLWGVGLKPPPPPKTNPPPPPTPTKNQTPPPPPTHTRTPPNKTHPTPTPPPHPPTHQKNTQTPPKNPPPFREGFLDCYLLSRSGSHDVMLYERQESTCKHTKDKHETGVNHLDSPQRGKSVRKRGGEVGTIFTYIRVKGYTDGQGRGRR